MAEPRRHRAGRLQLRVSGRRKSAAKVIATEPAEQLPAAMSTANGAQNCLSDSNDPVAWTLEDGKYSSDADYPTPFEFSDGVLQAGGGRTVLSTTPDDPGLLLG